VLGVSAAGEDRADCLDSSGLGWRQVLGGERERPGPLAVMDGAHGGGVPGQVGEVVLGKLGGDFWREVVGVVLAELELDLGTGVGVDAGAQLGRELG